MIQETVTNCAAIASFFKEQGREAIVAGNRPILLDLPQKVWMVAAGKVELFSVEIGENNSCGSRHHLYTAQEGQLVFGIGRSAEELNVGLLAVGTQGTRLLSVDLERLGQWAEIEAHIPELAEGINAWITGMSRGISQDVNPRTDVRLTSGVTIRFADGKKISARQDPVWIRALEGKCLFIGMEQVDFADSSTAFPVSRDSWLQALGQTRADVFTTSDVVKDRSVWKNLELFHNMLMTCEFFNIRLVIVDEFNRLKLKNDNDAIQRDASLKNLASILDNEAIESFDSKYQQPLFEACKIIAKVLNLEVRMPVISREEPNTRVDLLSAIAKASSFHTRRVLLRDDWFRKDNGPLLAYYEESMQPVALIPSRPGQYELHDPHNKLKTVVTEELAALMSPIAYYFYRPFPYQEMTLRDVLVFALRGQRREFTTILGIGALMGLLSMLMPIATGLIFDTIIPGAERGQLLQISIALFAAAIASALFVIVRSLAMLRLETNMDSATQAAIWDRVLNIPIPFFRDYSSGDLAIRTNGISTIRRTLSGATMSSLLSGIFAIFNLALLFYYSSALAILACVLTLVTLGATTVTAYYQLRYTRKLEEIGGRIAGKILQLFSGIAKIKVAGAEGRAFGVWAKEYTELKRISFKSSHMYNILGTFNTIFPTISTILVYVVLLKLMVESASSGTAAMTTGDFLAFSAAYGMFSGAAVSLGNVAISILKIQPLYERTKPILQTLPENDPERQMPGTLKGAIEVNGVSFRYTPEGPRVLNNLSLSINPGEFVAIVGASGSGKSTLLKLLLGFDTPETGSIYYDGQDLSNVDVQAVRQQIGVVLQSGQLMPGAVHHNIIGSKLLAIEDAWEAARKVGLAEDIHRMPMGMHTWVGEGGGGFSGGQRQRMLIARAIVDDPRIIFFDEATSALDNRTQKIVSKSLEDLQATRVVIAHRLSTIINADRIYVLSDGKLVQQGNYEELMKLDGPFQQLAKRQMT